MEFESNRRRFLELAGPTTAAALAGCSALSGSDSDSNAESHSTDQTDAPAETRRVAVSVEPDQQALQERQAEIRSALQEGNITRTQAQQRFSEAQSELVGEAMTSFRERARESSSLTVEDSIQEFGVLLLSGSPVALLDTLSIEGVVGLLPEATFEEAQAQVQTGTTTGTPSA